MKNASFFVIRRFSWLNIASFCEIFEWNISSDIHILELESVRGDSSRKVEYDRRAILVALKKLLHIVSVNSKDLELARTLTKENRERERRSWIESLIRRVLWAILLIRKVFRKDVRKKEEEKWRPVDGVSCSGKSKKKKYILFCIWSMHNFGTISFRWFRSSGGDY